MHTGALSISLIGRLTKFC